MRRMLLGKTIFKKSTKNSVTWLLVKSERINALRKQYDAFLEEDKRRKERNDYILGRLDKMRFCTKIVPVRHKHNVSTDRKDIVSPSSCQPFHTSSFSQHTLSVDVLRKPSDDTFALQEISKKYILIPKTKPVDVNVNLQPIRQNFEDNSDWQSKYHILEQLKREEKESDISTSTNKYKNKSANQEQEDNEIHDIIVSDKVEPPTSSYKYELPERDKNANITFELQDQTSIDIHNDEHKTHATSDTVTDHHNESKSVSMEVPQPIELDISFKHYNEHEQIGTTQVNDNIELQPELEYNLNAEPVYETDPNAINENIIESGYPLQEDFGMYDNQYVPFEEEKDRITDTEKQIKADENIAKSVEGVSPNNFINETNTNVQENSKLQENLEYPDSTNVQEFTSGPESYIDQENYNSAYQMDPSSQIVTEHAEAPVDSTGIEEFENEQKEMFYSENAEQSYPYNEDETVEGTYNQDLTVQSSYPQQEDAVYYKDSEPEQEYPVEIDEHGEAGQRYDPNYEEQYGVAYTQQYQQEGYEQQEYSQQPQYEQQEFSQLPQYESDTVDQVQQGIGQLQFEEQQYETTEYVQQQPNSEQGIEQLQFEEQQYETTEYVQQQADSGQGIGQQQFEEQQYETTEYVQQQADSGQGIGQQQFEEQQYETTEYVQQQLDSEQGIGEIQQEQVNISETEKPIEKLQTGDTPINLH